MPAPPPERRDELHPADREALELHAQRTGTDPIAAAEALDRGDVQAAERHAGRPLVMRAVVPRVTRLLYRVVGRAPREATNARRRGSRRVTATRAGPDDEGNEGEPPERWLRTDDELLAGFLADAEEARW
jgi:hypothetical protein